ncbi:MAG: hypothetical protein JSU68_00755 [Phycisphaerales bacterium]|nr:MAG: hypothetical protein JSU68_00755 [Phycisphaerales bacterium]
MTDFGINTPQLVLLALLVVTIALTLGNTRRKLRQRGRSPSEYAREQVSRLKEQQGVKGDLEQLLIELHEAARRLNAQMDTKASRLEALIRDADARIIRLEQTLAASAPGSRVQSSPPQAGSPEIDVAVGDSTGGAEPSKSENPVRHRILSLAREGRNAVQIAQDTGVPPGEVQLILALHGASGPIPSPSPEA